jgi:hypothetical protein
MKNNWWWQDPDDPNYNTAMGDAIRHLSSTSLKLTELKRDILGLSKDLTEDEVLNIWEKYEKDNEL